MSAGVSAGMAASAAASASEAREAAWCSGVLQSFNAPVATVEAKRDYAHCVYRIYGDGEPMGAAAVLLLKVAIGLALIGAVYGGVKGWRDDGPALAVLGIFIGAVAPFAAAGALVLLWLGLQFLVGAA